MKYYAVQAGRGGPAVYKSWEECKAKVDRYPGAKFKSFDSEEEAKRFAFHQKNQNKSLPPADILAYTDGSYMNYGDSGYGAVLIKDGKPIVCLYGPTTKDPSMRNVGGEIEAAERAISAAIILGGKHVRIFHDYEGVGAWGDGLWSRTKYDTIRFYEFVQAARKSITVSFEKVKGHSGIQYNELADALAEKGAKSRVVRVEHIGSRQKEKEKNESSAENLAKKEERSSAVKSTKAEQAVAASSAPVLPAPVTARERQILLWLKDIVDSLYDTDLSKWKLVHIEPDADILMSQQEMEPLEIQDTEEAAADAGGNTAEEKTEAKAEEVPVQEPDGSTKANEAESVLEEEKKVRLMYYCPRCGKRVAKKADECRHCGVCFGNGLAPVAR